MMVFFFTAGKGEAGKESDLKEWVEIRGKGASAGSAEVYRRVEHLRAQSDKEPVQGVPS